MGLCWDMIGVVILVRSLWKVPADWLTPAKGLDFYRGGPEGAIEENSKVLAAWLEQNRSEARPGLILVALGFVFQLVSTLWP